MVMCTRAKVAHDDQQKKKLPIIRARINFLSALVLSRFGAHQTAAATVKSSTTISGQQPLSVRPAHHAHHGVLPSDRRPAKEGGQDRTEDNPFGMDPSLNVYGEKLEQCGTQPMTGFFRDGYCNTAPADHGSHTVAAVVSDQWLNFSASRGNDLRGLLNGGCRWCLCASRWKESFDAWKRGEIDRDSVPKVMLSSTHQKALDRLNFDDLRTFSADHSPPTDPAQGGPIR